MSISGYFERIGVSRPHAPSLAALDALIAAHVAAIPFSNVDILLGDGVSLAPDAVAAKLIGARRGGYCFEQNGLFQRVLTALGYAPAPIGARVLMGGPPENLTHLTHLALVLPLDGARWLVDVGFGGLSPTAALRLEPGLEQDTAHGRYRLMPEGAEMVLQTKLDGAWFGLYRLTLAEMPFVDQELGNWWTSTHPTGGFRHRLAVARAAPGGVRLSLTETKFTRRRNGDVENETPIEHRTQVLALLRDAFGLDYPEDTRFALPGVAWAER